MVLWASLPPEHNYLQVPPPAEVRSAESLGVPKWPEIDRQNPVFILREKVSWNVGKIIHIADKGVVTKATSEKTTELRMDREKKEFLIKLYPILKADSPIKQAIEKKTLQIHEVPGRNLYAISLDGRDVDMIFDKSGKEHYDFHWSRADMMRYAALRWASDSEFTEKVIDGRYRIIKNRKSLDPLSSESLTEYAKWADYMREFIRRMDETLEYWEERDKKKSPK